MSDLTTVDRRTNISKRELYHDYVLKGLPVVLTDATREWKAIGKLTPEFFKEKYGHIKVDIDGKIYLLGDIVDMMLVSTEENPSPYPCNINVDKIFPELVEYFLPHIAYGKANRIFNPLIPKSFLKGTEVAELFFGGKGSFFPTLHIDALFLHTQITQIYGGKEFYIFPPDQVEFMYPRNENPKLSSIKNPLDPDYEKFPLFRKAKPIKVMVNEGETILFSTGWWHYTIMYEPSISYGMVQLNRSNYEPFISDNIALVKKYHPQMAAPLNLYSKLAGVIMNAAERII
jgi:histone arginine demethylase JMJD6